MLDLKSRVDVQPSLHPLARTTGTATGTPVDLRLFSSALALVRTGEWTDGTHTPSLEHSVDGTEYSAVGPADLDGAFTPIAGTEQENQIQAVGYKGGMPYVRGKLVSATSSTGAMISLDIVRGDPKVAPPVA